MKKYFLCFIFFVGFNPLLLAESTRDKVSSFQNSYWDNFKFSQIPILHSGRIKPLSTFSREYLLLLYEKPSLPDRSPEQWLIETLLDPKTSLNRPLFKIRNPELVDILNLHKTKNNIYSFKEISKALDQILDQLNEIQSKPEEKRNLIEKQLFNLYLKVHSYFQLSRSFFMILPLFSLESSKLSRELGISPHKKYSYLEMLKFQVKIDQKIKKLKENSWMALLPEEKQLILLSYKMNQLSKNEENHLFRIIPPQWEENKELWRSPWSVLMEGKGSPLSASYLEHWIKMEKAYRKGESLKPYGEALYRKAMEVSKNFSSPLRLYMEKIFNDIHFFKKSLALYLIAFFSLLLSFVGLRNFFYRLACVSLVSGFLLHLMGVIFRIYIMSRPPVSTLYESILFVGLVILGLTLLLEKQSWSYKVKRTTDSSKEKGVGLLVGSLGGTLLHFIAFKYKGSESMSFWFQSSIPTSGWPLMSPVLPLAMPLPSSPVYWDMFIFSLNVLKGP